MDDKKKPLLRINTILQQHMQEWRRKKGCKTFLLFTVFPVLLIILGIVYICYQSLVLQTLSKEKDFGVVIDVGSNGTRVHLFKWNRRQYESNSKINRITKPYEVYNFKYGKSLSEMPLNEIRDVLIDLLDRVKEQLEIMHNYISDRWKSYPLYLQATAGMRNLNSFERDIRMHIIRTVLMDVNVNPFHFLPDYARVISGEEEGIYGWLSVNNALNTIFSSAHETFGAIDLGGASTQLTFFPIDTSILEDFNGIHLDNTLIRLYSHSFIGYGWKDALFRLNIILLLKKMIHLEMNGKFNFDGKKMEQLIKEEQGSIDEQVEYNDDKKNKEKYYTSIANTLHNEFITYVKDQKEINEPKSNINKVSKINNEEHMYKFNIFNEQPYYVEDFIKKIRNFSRDSSNDTILVVKNPCFPNPLELKIILPSFNLSTNEFIFLEEPESEFMTEVEPDSKGAEMNRKKISNPQKESTNANEIENVLTDKHGNPLFIQDRSKLFHPYGKKLQYSNNEDINILLKNKEIVHSEALWNYVFKDFQQYPSYNTVLEAMEKEGLENNISKEDVLKNLFQREIKKKDHNAYVNFTVKFVGSNEFEECAKEAQSLFYKESCFLSSCSFNGVYQPNLENNKFVAYGQFKKVMQNLGFKKKIDLDSMKGRIAKRCNLDFKDLKDELKQDDMTNGQIKQFCWKSIWAYSLLLHGFKFNEKSDIMILSDQFNIEEEEVETEEEEQNKVDKKSSLGSCLLCSLFGKNEGSLRMNKYFTNEENQRKKDSRIGRRFFRRGKFNRDDEVDKLYEVKNKTDNVSWTQGYMIYQVNFFPKYIDFRKSQTYLFILTTVAMILLLFIVFLFGMIHDINAQLAFCKSLKFIRHSRSSN